MTSKIQICNQALIALGQTSTIEDISENPTLESIYDSNRQTLLGEHNWYFATVVTSLATVTSNPTNYTYAFQLPTSPIMLKIAKLIDSSSNKEITTYEIFADKVYCESAGVTLYYVTDITDPTKYPTSFTEAYKLSLAKEIAYAITKDKKIKREIGIEYALAYKAATGSDAKQRSGDAFKVTVGLGSYNETRLNG